MNSLHGELFLAALVKVEVCGLIYSFGEFECTCVFSRALQMMLYISIARYHKSRLVFVAIIINSPNFFM